jgi:hypothetical protein
MGNSIFIKNDRKKMTFSAHVANNLANPQPSDRSAYPGGQSEPVCKSSTAQWQVVYGFAVIFDFQMAVSIHVNREHESPTQEKIYIQWKDRELGTVAKTTKQDTYDGS